MRILKGWITTTCLAAMLVVSTTTANAGIIIGGGNISEQPCTNTTKEGKIDYGIIIGGALTGIIIGGFTGIIIGGGNATDVPTENCGIIIGG